MTKEEWEIALAGEEITEEMQDDSACWISCAVFVFFPEFANKLHDARFGFGNYFAIADSNKKIFNLGCDFEAALDFGNVTVNLPKAREIWKELENENRGNAKTN